MHQQTTRLAPWILIGLALASQVGCAAEINDPSDDSLGASSSDALTKATTFTGTLSSSGKSWVVHEIAITEKTDVEATLNWTNTNANLNLYVYVDTVGPAGSGLVAYSNKSARPEIAKKTGLVGKKLLFGIKAKTGGTSSYTLTVKTTTADAPPPPPPPPPTCALDSFPGRPAPGKLFWGSSIGGNSDPVARHEVPSGETLAIRRTFFAWSARAGSMVTMAKNDIAAGRLPWVSTKTPAWADVASGKHDAEIDQMLKALDALPGPVWLTIHHEPEGGGGVAYPDDPAGPAGHLAMNKRVRERMTALKTDNIALAAILMSWTWDSRSGRNPDEWYADGVYDILGIDHYRESEASMLTSVWKNIRLWAEDRCIPIAVGEWGVRGSSSVAAGVMREWFEHAAGSSTDGAGAPVLGLSAFDSALNSPNGSWELVGEQLTTFHALMADPRVASIRN